MLHRGYFLKNSVVEETYLGDYVGEVIERDFDTTAIYGAQLFGNLDVDAGPMGSCLRFYPKIIIFLLNFQDISMLIEV